LTIGDIAYAVYIPLVAAVFGEDMVDDGYQDVVNIDISSVVIDQMKKKYHEKPQLKCNTLCCMPLQFSNSLGIYPT
jgi:hypothetical protein